MSLDSDSDELPTGGNLYRLYYDPRSAPVVYRQPQFMQNRYKIAILGAPNVGKSALFERLCYDTFQGQSTVSGSTVPSENVMLGSTSTSQTSTTSDYANNNSSHNLAVDERTAMINGNDDDGGEGERHAITTADDIMTRSNIEPSVQQEILTLTLQDKTKMTVDIVDVPGTALPLNVLTLRDCSGVVLVYSLDDKDSFANVDVLMRQLKHCCPPDCDVLIVGNKCDVLDKEKTITRAVPLAKTNDYATSHGCSLYECSAKTSHNVRDAFTELVLKLREKTPMGEYEGTVDGVESSGHMWRSSPRKSNVTTTTFSKTQPDGQGWCVFKCW